jgi:hypothetical protein
MKKKVFFIALIGLGMLACEKPRERDGAPGNSSGDISDREPNGGFLRCTLAGKAMHDRFFVAQFTPRGELFEEDNLQLYNYHIGSEKYPQFLISIDHLESDPGEWSGVTFPLDFLAFTAAPNTTPLNSRGELVITKVTGATIEGRFAGELIHPVSNKTFPIRGDFKAMIVLNI